MKSVRRCLSTVFLGAFGLWVVCLVPAAEAANGLLATHRDYHRRRRIRASRLSRPTDWQRGATRRAIRQFVVRLNRTGDRAGSIAIQDPHLQKSFPMTVEDHWRAYCDQPQFRSWITDPRYRVVIEPTEPDRRCLNLEQDR